MKNKEPRFYVAYGSNLNVRQMAYRCPTARLCATGVIKDYELQFKGQPQSAFATIAKKPGSEVPVAVWEIQRADEYFLDRYEGYPSHYFKKDVPVELSDGREIKAMVYIMNLRMDYGMPSTHYYRTVHQGYLDCKLDTNILNKALGDSAQKFYASSVGTPSMQMKIKISERSSQIDEIDDEEEIIDEEDELLNEDYDDEDDDIDESDEETDVNDPFYASDGMCW